MSSSQTEDKGGKKCSPAAGNTQSSNSGALAIPASLSNCTTQLALLQSWIVRPMRDVGPTTVGLQQVDTGKDNASKSGTKSQIYTSWDSFSRSYLVSYAFSPSAGRHKRYAEEREGTCEWEQDVPTQQEMQEWTEVERNMYTLGKKKFFRGIGLLTAAQMKTEKYIRLLLERCAHSGAPTESSDTDQQPDSLESTSHRVVTRSAQLTSKGSRVKTPVALESTSARKGTQTDEKKTTSKAENTTTVKSGQATQTEAKAPEQTAKAKDTGKSKTTASQPETSKPESSSQVRDDDQNVVWFSDTMPVRVVAVGCWRHDYERSIAVPYSPMFTSLAQRLSDPAATGALGALTRSPTVRDASSVMSLAKFLMADTGSVMEVAPMVRIMCMALSIIPDCYSTEILPYRVVRGVKKLEYVGVEISPVVAIRPAHSRMLAVPLDLFTNFMLDKQPPLDEEDIFGYQTVDYSWTAVPIRSETMRQRGAVPYIGSFLTSTLWSGSVNHVYTGTVGNAAGTQENKVVIRLMPSVNSVYMEGPKDVVLVLVDYTSQNCPPTVRVAGMEIPVYRGQSVPEDELFDFMDIWNVWWSNGNINTISRDAGYAHKQVCQMLGVENSCLIANAMAAELYATLYQGIAVSTEVNRPQYDWDQAGCGAWSFYNGDVVAKDSRLKTNWWNPANDSEHFASGRRRIVGYNFSAISTWARPPTGLARTQTGRSVFNNTGSMRIWYERVPAYHTPAYTLSTCSSLTRVAIYVKLVLTHEKNVIYDSPNGMGTHIHMLAGATAAQTSLIFSQSNLALAAWTGYDTRKDDVFTTDTMQKCISFATADIASYTDIQVTAAGWPDWDEDVIFEYYNMDPFNNVNWESNFPLPHHFSLQWSIKIELTTGVIGDETYFRHNGRNHQGIMITPGTLQYRALMYCTIDADRYFPVLVYRQEDQPLEHLKAWVDQWSFVSLKGSGSTSVVNASYLESQELVIPMVDNGLSYAPSLVAYIVGSAYSHRDDNFRKTRVSDLLLPDPIDWARIIEGAKNYLFIPAAAAVKGFVTGGPIGALIAGGSALASKIIERNAPSQVKTDLQEIANTGKRVLETTLLKKQETKVEPERPIHSVDTHKGEIGSGDKNVPSVEKVQLEKTQVQPSPLVDLATAPDE